MNTYDISFQHRTTSGRRSGPVRYVTLRAASAVDARFTFEDRHASGRRGVQIIEIREVTTPARAVAPRKGSFSRITPVPDPETATGDTMTPQRAA